MGDGGCINCNCGLPVKSRLRAAPACCRQTSGCSGRLALGASFERGISPRSAIAMNWRNRANLETVAAGLHGHLPQWRNATPAVGPSRLNNKTAGPLGDERCLARGTTPLHRHIQPAAAFTHIARAVCAMWLLCNGSTRCGLVSQQQLPAVRGKAQRSYSLTFPVPLRSNRGSLTRSGQVLVLFIARDYSLGRHVTSRPGACQPL
jgi:hypothetical protein